MQEWFGFILESDEAIVIAFEELNLEADWIADARIRQRPYPYNQQAGLVHEGFLAVYESCRDEIFETYQSLHPQAALYNGA